MADEGFKRKLTAILSADAGASVRDWGSAVASTAVSYTHLTLPTTSP